MGRALRAALANRPLRNLLARSRSEPVDGRRIDPDTAAMLALSDFGGQTDLLGKTPAAVRKLMREQILAADGPAPESPRRESLVVNTPDAALPARLYVPDSAPSPAPALVFFHGGGWVVCDLDTHDGLCARLAERARCRVVSVDYRLGPEHPFPTPVTDAVAATRWVLANAERLGIDSSRVGVAGDSAGGNLSAIVSLKLRGEERSPALQVLIYAGLELTQSLPSHRSMGERFFLTRENIDWYLGHYVPTGVDLRQPDISPLFADDVAGCPRAIVVTAGFDPLRDEGEAYAKRLAEAGVPTLYREHESLIHGFALMTAAVPEAARAVDRLADDVREALESGGRT